MVLRWKVNSLSFINLISFREREVGVVVWEGVLALMAKLHFVDFNLYKVSEGKFLMYVYRYVRYIHVVVYVLTYRHVAQNIIKTNNN